VTTFARDVRVRDRLQDRHRHADNVRDDVDGCDGSGVTRGGKIDNHKRFVLDNRFFSSIIYIWYEGGGLRPPVVER
jgi:hypothetical protein